MNAQAPEQRITLRTATSADISVLMQIERLPGYPALIGTYTEAEHRERLAAAGQQALLCLADGRPCGFAALRFDRDGMGTVQLHRLGVAPGTRGVGTRFLRKVCDTIFADPGIDRIWLDVLPSNAIARHVYTKLGFREEGTMRRALRTPDGARHDLILMARVR